MELPERYSRLARYAPLGQSLPRWQAARVAVVGCGGLGGGLALQLARMGVGSASVGVELAPPAAVTHKDRAEQAPPLLTIIDRDTVGPENLGHQALFTEADSAAGLPKAIAAANAVAAVNSAVRIDAHVASLDRRNVHELLAGCALIFDGLDSYATRFLLNDYALATGTPYLYAGAVRGELSARAIVPGVTGCLRCLFEAPPAPGEAPTCAAEGVFPPLLGLANLLQLDAANRILAGTFTAADDALYSFRMDNMQLRRTPLGGPAADCPACAGRYDYLDGLLGGAAAHACAPDRVELELADAGIRLERAEMLLAASGGFELKRNPWCLTAQADDGLRYTIFASGRLVLQGSGDPLALERFAATYLGV